MRTMHITHNIVDEGDDVEYIQPSVGSHDKGFEANWQQDQEVDAELIEHEEGIQALGSPLQVLQLDDH